MIELPFSDRDQKLFSRLGPSAAFGAYVVHRVTNHSNTQVLTADLASFSGLNRLKKSFPSNYINVGIAEQNLIGVACGLEKSGFECWVTSYASFISLRCADQIKVALGYMKTPIRVVGLSAGYAAGILGPTHTALEDIALFKAIPNIEIFSPCDINSMLQILISIEKDQTPVYLRLTGGPNSKLIYGGSENRHFEFGRANVLKEGKDISIYATGTVVANVLAASEILEKQGISVKVIDIHSISPFDTESLRKDMDKRAIFSFEEHAVGCGLGSTISNFLSGFSSHPPLYKFGANGYLHADSYELLLKLAGLDVESIAISVIRKLEDIK